MSDPRPSPPKTWLMCRFERGNSAAKLYAYQSDMALLPQRGDLLVVGASGKLGYTCVEFVEENPHYRAQPGIVYKWAVHIISSDVLDPPHGG